MTQSLLQCRPGRGSSGKIPWVCLSINTHNWTPEIWVPSFILYAVCACVCLQLTTFMHLCTCDLQAYVCVFVCVWKHLHVFDFCCEDVCVCSRCYVYIHVRVRVCETSSIPISFSLISAPLGALQLTWKGRGAPERLQPWTGPPRWGRGVFKGLVWPQWDQQTQLICHCNSIFTSFQFQRAVWLH